MNTTLYVRQACWNNATSHTELINDWKNKKDFQIIGPECYCSIRDLDEIWEEGYTEIRCKMGGQFYLLEAR